MPLAPGTRIGSYEVVGSLGAGGMGEVYRARDTKLGRDVALKILPDVFAGDADRLARFEREAKTLASLNHPNIAHVYDAGRTRSGLVSETSPDLAYLVMELVEGDDLSTHIARGPMTLADALPIAKQITDALEAAHDSGIVHRDLKPANVKVRPDGIVKVLDFGLAKALAPDGASATADSQNSPTLTARATQMGMIIGTAAYMAPEQARGRAVDRRADIWAFGVVLYEMLAGKRAFEGEDISITLAGVLKEDVRWDALPADVPPSIRRLLRRCLEKDPTRRLGWIGEARLMLEDDGGQTGEWGQTPGLRGLMRSALWRRALPWTVAAAGLAAGLVSIILWAPWRAAPAPPTPRRLLAGIGADASLTQGFGASAILSPDGTTLAFVALQSGQSRLFVRKLGELQAASLAGTEDAVSPFFSPTGDWIAYFAGGKLKKVSVTGGASVPLCDAPAGRGGTWADDDTIFFTPAATTNVVVMRVPAAGGTPVAFGVLSKDAVSQRWPQVLPGGKGVLYSENSSTANWDAGNIVIVPLSGGTPKIVVRGGYYGRYVASGLASPKRSEREGGHLLYMQQGTVFAIPFDLDRLEPAGQAVPAVEGVEAFLNTGGIQLSVASEGTLVFVPGTAATAANPIDWMTRDGKTAVLRAAKSDWASPRFSPDGQKLALEMSDGKQRDIWVYEWARDTLTQLTFDAGQDRSPVWTPDNRHIVFNSDRAKAGISNLYWANADGTGEVTRLTDSPDVQVASSWHPSGKFLAFQQPRRETGWDLMILPMEGDATRGWKPGAPTLLLGTPGAEVMPMFSPDGRWIAYFSNEAGGGSFDVYVRPFPGPGGKWRVSTQTGLFPHWSPTAHELLFLSQGQVMTAPYSVVGDSFRVDKPQVWSPTHYIGLGTNNPYDIHPDGKRLAIIAAQDQGAVARDKVVFVSNFFDYLNKIAPAKK